MTKPFWKVSTEACVTKTRAFMVEWNAPFEQELEQLEKEEDATMAHKLLGALQESMDEWMSTNDPERTNKVFYQQRALLALCKNNIIPFPKKV